MQRRALLLAAGSLAAPAIAQSWPAGPIRIVVPFPPGGSVDTLARLLSPRLGAELGVPIVVENRAGASGALGAAAVARATPDGNTWLFVFDTHAVNPALIANLGYDHARDLAPLMLIGTAPMIVTASRGRPFQDFSGVVAAARARPDSLTYGSIGNGSLAHLAMSLIQKAGGFQLVHVPYRGGGPLANAAVAAEVDLPVATQALLGPHIASGALRALAQTGATRSPLLPSLPTVTEQGVPGVDARAFWGALAPARAPEPVQARFHAALAAAIREPATAARMAESLGIDLAVSSPGEFAAFLAEQTETWSRVVRENNIRPD
jgi:tripartite-type tricarboxylate transporter receptor subunit TctC